LGILPGTPLAKKAEEMGLELDHMHEPNWFNYNNPELTIEQRIWRVKQAKELANQYGLLDNYTLMQGLLSYLEKNIEKFNTRLKVKKLIKLKLSNQT
jgi:hypothetical protein